MRYKVNFKDGSYNIYDTKDNNEIDFSEVESTETIREV